MLNVVRNMAFILRHPLNRRRSIRTIGRWFRWQLGSRLLGTRVAIPWINQTRLLVGNGDWGLTGNVYCGLHEFEEMAFVAHLLNSNDLFVDIGANAGSYTVLASGVTGCRVIAVEPVASTFERLVDNVNLNRLHGRTILHNVAIGPADGTLSFSRELDTVNHVLRPSEAIANVDVLPSKSLDQITASFLPTLLKIDVEGYEMGVLAGGSKTLSAESLLAVIIEVNNSGKGYGFSNLDVHNRLLEFGFASYRYVPSFRILEPIVPDVRRGDNAIYIRDAEAVGSRLKSAPKIAVCGVEL